MRRGILAVFIILFGFSLIFFSARDGLGDNLDDVCYLKAKGIVSRIINQAIHDNLSGEDFEKNIFIVNGQGDSVKTIQTNTNLLNSKIADFGLTLQECYEDMEPKKTRIPLGALTGSKLMSMSGLGITIKVLPLSVSKCDYESDFEEQGINQTKYKIYLKVKSTVRVLQPFSSKNISVENRILLGEMVILGDVPNSYVNVPKEDILDAIN
ncbi:MAG: sporulation protein YunB [Eubacteriaceae bacterium]|nr:sporulation protein YunB [Eubacteriaceae bacterium]